MYNSEVKEQFIQDYTTSLSTADVCRIAFKAIGKFEREWDADFCTKSTEELTPVIEQLVGYRVKGKTQRVLFFKEYVRWCLSHDIPGACDGMLYVEVDGAEKIRTRMVSNPLQLQNYLNQICDPETDKTTDIVVRCFYWMAYAGVKEVDIQNITADNLDFDQMIIRCGDNEYEIYRESVLAFKYAATLTEFVYKHPNYPPDKIVIRNRVPGKELIRGIRGKSTIINMRTQLSRRSMDALDKGITDKQLSYSRVRLSGLFYRMKKREDAGLPVDFTDAAVEFMQNKTYKLDSGRNTQEAIMKKIKKDYMNDYERWKSVVFDKK